MIQTAAQPDDRLTGQGVQRLDPVKDCDRYDQVNQVDRRWLALAIGNSRCHWAAFSGPDLLAVAHHIPATPWPIVRNSLGLTIDPKIDPRIERTIPLPIAISSVVPGLDQSILRDLLLAEAAHEEAAHETDWLSLDRVPLAGLYPQLGLDRALALWGAGQTWGWPMLVIDGGTALTVTAAVCDGNDLKNGDSTGQKLRFSGGAIWPGLALQLASLGDRTAALPHLDPSHLAGLPLNLPPRFAQDTATAMTSGVVYGAIAALADWLAAWRSQVPAGRVVLTGGDGALLAQVWRAIDPETAATVHLDPHALFWGIRDLAFGGRWSQAGPIAVSRQPPRPSPRP